MMIVQPVLWNGDIIKGRRRWLSLVGINWQIFRHPHLCRSLVCGHNGWLTNRSKVGEELRIQPLSRSLILHCPVR